MRFLIELSIALEIMYEKTCRRKFVNSCGFMDKFCRGGTTRGYGRGVFKLPMPSRNNPHALVRAYRQCLSALPAKRFSSCLYHSVTLMLGVSSHICYLE